MGSSVNRRTFLKASAATVSTVALNKGATAQESGGDRPVKLGFVGVGNRGSYHLDCALGMENVEVLAVCDTDDGALYRAKRWVEDSGRPSPRLYGGSETAYQKLCETEDLDCVICCTPWDFHTPVCVASMTNGKNAVSEVPILLTEDQGWELVETHEKTGKWATLGLEGFGDLTLMNMVRQGLFGDVLHAEGGYVHDLRMVKFNPLEEPWRLQHSIDRNGNLYPDHPMSRILRLLDINHGDRFDRLVSMSSKAVMLNEYAAHKFGEEHPYAATKMSQGDVNVTLLHTEGGKVVTLNFDTNTPHPREAFRLQGTKGVFQSGITLPTPQADRSSAPAEPYWRRRGARAMMYIDGRSPESDRWESAAPYYEEYEHPYLKSYQPQERKRALRGHGGGSSTTPVTWVRLVNALRAGKITDYDVYDSVASSVISPLSEKSVAGGSVPVEFPDFTRGKYKTAKPFDIEPI